MTKAELVEDVADAVADQRHGPAEQVGGPVPPQLAGAGRAGLAPHPRVQPRGHRTWAAPTEEVNARRRSTTK